MKLLVVLLCSALAIQTNRVLIVSDSVGIYISHSLLFDRLKEQGYKLEFKNLQTFLNLQSYGEWLYDHAIIFASSTKDLTTPEKSFLDFFDAGKNIILLGTPNQSRYFRKLQNQFGFDMHERGVTVQDFFNNLNTPDNSLTKNINIFQISKNVAYAGSGLSLSPYETNQVYGLVRGSETAFSGNIYGHNIIYVGGTQGRNNARFVTTGGYDVFSNEFLTNTSLGNLELLDTTIRWTFGQINVLRVQNIQHRRVNSTELNPQNYKVSEDIYFSLEIQQWDYKTQSYVPYISNADDVILEFTMLDPYYRVPLKKGKGSIYELEFRLPDKYGVFQFKVQYSKPGYTFLNVAEKVTVRPLRHDEHPRYLTQAFPYYLSSFATMGGFLVFVLAFLFNK